MHIYYLTQQWYTIYLIYYSLQNISYLETMTSRKVILLIGLITLSQLHSALCVYINRREQLCYSIHRISSRSNVHKKLQKLVTLNN